MTIEPPLFRQGQPLAWTFHRATARWVFNAAAVDSPPPLPGRERPRAPWTPLPKGVELDTALWDVLTRRVSSRAFAPAGLELPALATMLRGAYGLLGQEEDAGIRFFDRPAPSAGGFYPLEISLLVRAVDRLTPGVYHYVPAADGLEQLRDGALPPQLVTYLFMGQPWTAQAAVVVVISAATRRSLEKYGDRGYRYLLLEAGHVGQNVALTAAALGLGAVNLGGFYDDELAALVEIDPEHEVPLYAAAVGVPAFTSRMEQRALSMSDEATQRAT